MEWTPVRIPAEQHQQISVYIEQHPERGYASVNEFVRDACRDKITRLTQEADP